MSPSTRLRVVDLRAMYRLVGECRALGDDPIQWRQHLLAELGRLTGGGFGIAAEIGNGRQPSRHDKGTTDWGAENGFDRDGWLRMVGHFQVDAFFNPLMNAYFDQPALGLCPARADLVRDREWYSSLYYQGFRRTLGADATILCLRRISDAADDYCGLYLLRPIGERDFPGRNRALAVETMAAITPLLGGPLARFGEPAPSALPPRLR